LAVKDDFAGVVYWPTLKIGARGSKERMMSTTEGSGLPKNDVMLPAEPKKPGGYRSAVIAGFSGWTLDAFDFFLVTFCLTAIAREFHKTDAQIALAITTTMLFRPVGGLVFGIAADRYGRRVPLMINIAFFAVAEIFTGLAPSYRTLILVRALFGVVMGGQWGAGTSLAMEQAPAGRRGLLSGFLQEGYAVGNILAGLAFFFLYGRLGWRPLFFLGSLPALLLLLFIRLRVKESEVWQKTKRESQKTKRESWSKQFREAASHWKLLLYFVAFMTMMICTAHGTQDMYPTFLQRYWHFSFTRRSGITTFAGLGAILGGIILGHLSDRWGRRRTIAGSLLFGLLIIPVWAFAPNQVLLVSSAFLLQFAVQGAFGIIPAHLAELAPNSARAFLPGFAYQSAGVLAGSLVYLEALFAEKTSYPTAMALTASSVFLLAAIMALLGKERRGQEFGL
jgi:MFS transporter, SHS family, lactate transporter